MISNEKNKLVLFTLITFFSSWLIWFISGVLLRKGYFIYDSKWLFAQTGAFAPSIVAIFFMNFEKKESRKKNIIIILFFLLVFAVGFTVIANNPTSIKDFNTFASVLFILLTFTIIFIIFHSQYKYLKIRPVKQKNGRFLKWIIASIIFFPALFLVAWIFANIPQMEFQISVFQDGFIKFIQILFLTFSLNFLFGGSLGEEFGWRGFVLPFLLEKYNPVGASLILGLIWANWHFPIDITSSITPGLFAVMFRIIWTLPLTIIFTWFFVKTNGSILITLFLHTSVNILPDLGFNYYEKSLIILT